MAAGVRIGLGMAARQRGTSPPILVGRLLLLILAQPTSAALAPLPPLPPLPEPAVSPVDQLLTGEDLAGDVAASGDLLKPPKSAAALALESPSAIGEDRPVRETDAVGRERTTEYDELGRVLRVRGLDGSEVTSRYDCAE